MKKVISCLIDFIIRARIFDARGTNVYVKDDATRYTFYNMFPLKFCARYKHELTNVSIESCQICNTVFMKNYVLTIEYNKAERIQARYHPNFISSGSLALHLHHILRSRKGRN